MVTDWNGAQVLMVSLKAGEVKKRRLRLRTFKKIVPIYLMKNHEPGDGAAKGFLQIDNVHTAGDFGAEFIFPVPVDDRG